MIRVLTIALAAWLGLSTADALAQDTSPAANAITLDIGVTNGAAEVRMNDVPFLGPGQTLDAEASIELSVPMQRLFAPGRTVVTLRFRPGHFAGGQAPELRARFGYDPPNIDLEAFSERPYAVLVRLRRTAGSGGWLLEQTVRGQPLMTGKLASSKPTLLPDGSVEATVFIDTRINLPPQRWRGGQQLAADPATREALVGLMRSAHDAFATGEAAVIRELGPMIERDAALAGVPMADLIRSEYGQLLDRSVKLQPFDASRSQVVLYGDGRLATLSPSPVSVREEDGLVLFPILAWWRDAAGAWQIVH